MKGSDGGGQAEKGSDGTGEAETGGGGIREVIVVEGRDDTAAIKRALDAQTIETHGYGIRKETWGTLEAAYRSRGIIIFTDADFSGEEIRRKLTARFPKAKQAYLTVAESTQKGKIGVAYAAPEAIREAIRKARPVAEDGVQASFSEEDARLAGLAGAFGAAEKRAAVGKRLGIGYGNAKAFRNKLNRYGITPEELHEAIRAVDHCGDQG